MFVTRFWFLLLSAALGLILAVMYLLQDSMNAGLRKNVDDLVAADLAQVQANLKLQARAHLDRLSEITASEQLREALAPLAQVSILAPKPAAGALPAANPTAAEEQLEGKRTKVKGVLGELLKAHFQDLRRPFLLALNRRGEVVAHEGSFPPPEAETREFGLYGFPSVRAVLRGYERDDMWYVRIRNKAFLYQIAGRPVVHQGKYLGAVFLGRPVDDELAEEIRKAGGLNAQLFFFSRDAVVAKSLRAATTEGRSAEPPPDVDLRLILATVQREASDWLAYAGSPDRPVVAVGGGFRGAFAPVRGEAMEAGVGYMVLRPVVAVASPWTVLKSASKQGLSNVPVVKIIALCIGAVLLAMLWVYLERDRPLLFFQKHAGTLAKKDNERFNAYLFRGRYRQIALDVNASIERTVKALGGSRIPTQPDVAAILGPSAELKLGSHPIAGFNDEARPPEPAQLPAAVDLGILGPPGSKGARPQPGAPPPAGPPAVLMAAGPASSPPASPPPVQAPPVLMRPAAAPPSPPASPFGPPSPFVPPARVLPGAGPAPRAPMQPMAEPPPLDAAALEEEQIAEGADEPTRIAPVPSELLDAAQGRVDPSEKREADLRKLFHDFRSAKVQCGESIEGLTLDKFKASVEKNRSAIMQKQKCKDVQFSVYIKAGKAALKATPMV